MGIRRAHTSRFFIAGGALACGLALMLLLIVLSHPAAARAAAPRDTTDTSTTTTTTTTTTAEPPNNDRDNAQDLGTLPASVNGTTVGSALENDEPYGNCESLAGAVWYSVSFGATPPTQDVGLRLQDNGDLDACMDVFIKIRSQTQFVTSASTDQDGLGRLTFAPAKNTTYLIRVGQLSDSDPGTFNLQAFTVPPGASAPGPLLTAAGARGELDSFFTTTAAYSANLTAGISYKVNLVNLQGGCMELGIFPPHTTSFSSTQPLSSACSGYRLFTPTESGRFSFLITAASGIVNEQPYALHVAPASDAEIAPGDPLGNLQTVTGALNGGGQSVVRLYSLAVKDRSQLTVSLVTHADFGLELLKSDGRLVQCECDTSGDQQIQTITRPGDYYVAVRAEDFSSGRFTLTRQSRTITALKATANGRRAVTTAPGESVTLSARMLPVVSGSVTFEVDYFDPLSGWQFRHNYVEALQNGRATVDFLPPVAGHWRVIETFSGTRIAAPAASKNAYFYDATPLS